MVSIAVAGWAVAVCVRGDIVVICRWYWQRMYNTPRCTASGSFSGIEEFTCTVALAAGAVCTSDVVVAPPYTVMNYRRRLYHTVSMYNLCDDSVQLCAVRPICTVPPSLAMVLVVVEHHLWCLYSDE